MTRRIGNTEFRYKSARNFGEKVRGILEIEMEAAWSKLAGSLHVVEQNYAEEFTGQCPFPGPVALPRRHHPPRLDAIIMNARFTVEPDNLTPKKKTKRRRRTKETEKKKKRQKKEEEERRGGRKSWE